MLFLIKGIVLGFFIAAPVGPIGVLCIRRTLSGGRLNGFLSGLGAAAADTIYGCIAAFGITAISAFLFDHQLYVHLIGGFFLLYLGYTTYKSVPAEVAPKAGGSGLIGAFTSTFFLTLSNPMTIISFGAVFAGVGVGATAGDYLQAGILVFGIFIGSALWWLFLSGTVNMLRSRFSPKRMVWVNRLSGVIITGFGLLSIITI